MAARIAALIVAGGSGARFGAPLPKQFAPLAGQSVLRRAVTAFTASPRIGHVQVVAAADHLPRSAAELAGLGLPPPVAGGASRQESVRHGLDALAADPPDLVLIHDAARPLLPEAVLDRVLAALADHDGAIPALPVVDTLKRGADGLVTGQVPRDGLWRVQTPQGFRFAAIHAAHHAAIGLDLTDDAAVADRAGLRVALVAGDESLAKITLPEDLARAERLLAAGLLPQVGTGFDVHRFCPGNQVMLCGVPVPHDHGLEGHSDADVALHALTDALLGALAAGDIGSHFPPSDPHWRGADSARFLIHARDLIAAAGGMIRHVDVTIICERPRIGPHRPAMCARLAELLALDPRRVSVKATTTEGLGFTGRREGIAAQAVATIFMA